MIHQIVLGEQNALVLSSGAGGENDGGRGVEVLYRREYPGFPSCRVADLQIAKPQNLPVSVCGNIRRSTFVGDAEIRLGGRGCQKFHDTLMGVREHGNSTHHFQGKVDQAGVQAAGAAKGHHAAGADSGGIKLVSDGNGFPVGFINAVAPGLVKQESLVGVIRGKLLKVGKNTLFNGCHVWALS